MLFCAKVSLISGNLDLLYLWSLKKTIYLKHMLTHFNYTLWWASLWHYPSRISWILSIFSPHTLPFFTLSPSPPLPFIPALTSAFMHITATSNLGFTNKIKYVMMVFMSLTYFIQYDYSLHHFCSRKHNSFFFISEWSPIVHVCHLFFIWPFIQTWANSISWIFWTMPQWTWKCNMLYLNNLGIFQELVHLNPVAVLFLGFGRY